MGWKRNLKNARRTVRGKAKRAEREGRALRRARFEVSTAAGRARLAK